ncbi:hypothetical protein FACS1894202_02440 [Clostridia bacterium]|nr:hypothetical protein FACS1894202_02440 [Clostridia bacterium]
MSGKKSRILYIKRFLEEHTDENHPATAGEIAAHLESSGVSGNSRTIVQDINELIESGADVVEVKGRPNRYFVGDRHFELPELKLLVDAVRASRFIPPKKSAALIEKLSAFASVHQRGELQRELYAAGRVKSGNEKAYITVDILHTAINAKRRVAFKYYEYDRHGKKTYKHKRKNYIFSPYGLIWSDDRYYAVGFSESHGKIIAFRVDRIALPELLDKPAAPAPEGFDIAVYATSVFNMYDGPETDVTLKCENDLMKSVIDRFGEDIRTEIVGEDYFTATVRAAVSPTFYGWVFSFGGRIEIAAPEEARAGYSALARKAQSGAE